MLTDCSIIEISISINLLHRRMTKWFVSFRFVQRAYIINIVEDIGAIYSRIRIFFPTMFHDGERAAPLRFSYVRGTLKKKKGKNKKIRLISDRRFRRRNGASPSSAKGSAKGGKDSSKRNLNFMAV